MHSPHNQPYYPSNAGFPHLSAWGLILVVFFACSLLSCTGPVDFDRDNVHDPESDVYRILPPSTIQAIARPNGHIELSWPQPDADLSNLMGYIIEKFDWRTDSFVKFDSIGTVFSYTDSSYTYSLPATKYQIRPVFRRLGQAVYGEVSSVQINMGNIRNNLSTDANVMPTEQYGIMRASLDKGSAVYYDGVKISRIDGSKDYKVTAAHIPPQHSRSALFPYDQNYFTTTVFLQAYIVDKSDTLWYPELPSITVSNFRKPIIQLSINREDGFLLRILNTFRSTINEIRIEYYHQSKDPTQPIAVNLFSDFGTGLNQHNEYYLFHDTDLVFGDTYRARVQMITPKDTSDAINRSTTFNPNSLGFFSVHYETVNDVDLRLTLEGFSWDFMSELNLLRTDNINPPVVVATTTEPSHRFIHTDNGLDIAKRYSYIVRSRYQERAVSLSGKTIFSYQKSARWLPELTINRPRAAGVHLEPFHCYLRETNRLIAGGSTSTSPAAAGNLFREFDLNTNQIVYEVAPDTKVQRIWCDPDQSRYSVVNFENGDIWLYDSHTRSVIAENNIGDFNVQARPDVWIHPSGTFVLLRVLYGYFGEPVTRIIRWDISSNEMVDETIQNVSDGNIRGFISLPGRDIVLLALQNSTFYVLNPYTLEIGSTPAFTFEDYFRDYVISNDQESLYLANPHEILKIDIHSLNEVSRFPNPDQSQRIFSFYDLKISSSGNIYDASGQRIGNTIQISHLHYNPSANTYYYYGGGWGRLVESGRWQPGFE